ncbi:PREDICTED: uncharacterized protein LOC109327393 [Lupinus angustifolius]|uniref:uncharacterized protein LOC109327393 n=1 Tax=Lupinus angustifolius TaxID=3871 RepID=UPI00092E38D8|nr:PREDICTED: uncharacterized protein LOC109327393 [Lupinus angustifolius]
MFECNPASTLVEVGNIMCKGSLGDEVVDLTLYKQMLGSLRYMCNSILDIAYEVGLVSIYMEDPRSSQLLAAKRLLRYLKGSLDYGVLLLDSDENKLRIIYGYTDANWCGDKDDRKSTTGYLFKYGNAPISWSSKKQEVVTLSSREAEYIVVYLGGC